MSMDQINTAAYRNLCDKGGGLKGAGLKRLLNALDAKDATIANRDAEIERLRKYALKLEADYALLRERCDNFKELHAAQGATIRSLTERAQLAERKTEGIPALRAERDGLLKLYDEEIQNRLTQQADSARLTAELAAMTERCAWVPVAERLPEANVEVLVLTRAGQRKVALHDGTDGYRPWRRGTVRIIDISITHWMPLPQPPTAEKGADNA